MWLPSVLKYCTNGEGWASYRDRGREKKSSVAMDYSGGKKTRSNMYKRLRVYKAQATIISHFISKGCNK